MDAGCSAGVTGSYADAILLQSADGHLAQRPKIEGAVAPYASRHLYRQWPPGAGPPSSWYRVPQ